MEQQKLKKLWNLLRDFQHEIEPQNKEDGRALGRAKDVVGKYFNGGALVEKLKALRKK